MTTSFYEIFEKSRTNPSIYKNIEKSFDLELLRNTLKNIITNDPAQVRSYINTLNSFVFAKKFEIVPRANFIYKKPYNHDGRFIYFPEERMMLTIDNYHKGKSEDNYLLRVYHNGALLTPDKDYMVYTALGSKRIFLKSKNINEFDEISITAHRVMNLNQTAFYAISVPSSQYGGNFTYVVNDYNTGRFFDNPQNLSLFIKKFNELDGQYKYLERGTEYQLQRVSQHEVEVKVMVDVSKNDSILIVNKLANYVLTYDTGKQEDDQEYIEEAMQYTSIPLRFYNEVLEDHIPFPIESINEIDVFAAGAKLIPDVDYSLILKDEIYGIPTVKVHGVVLKDSRIHVENRLWDQVYNIAHTATHIDNSYGFIPMTDANIPMDSRYVEVFLGRRKVSEDDVSVIADCILKVDKQRCLEKLDVRSNLLISEDFTYLNEDYKNEKSDLAEVVENMGSHEFLAEYSTKNNPTTNLTDKLPLDPFMPNTGIASIRIELLPNTITQGIDELNFRIFGTLANGMEIDITSACVVEIENLEDLREPDGEGTITAIYKLNQDTEFTDNTTFIMEEKEIYGILIDFKTAVVEQGNEPEYKVYCLYFDNSRRDITKRPNLSIEMPNINTTGNKVLTATYTIGSEVYEDNKNFAIVVRKEVDFLKIIPEKLYILHGEEVHLEVLAYFKDGTTRDISSQAAITGYVPGMEGNQTIVATWDYGVSYSTTQSFNFVFKVGPIDAVVEESERSLKLVLQGVVPFNYKNFRVYKKEVVEDEGEDIINWIPVTTNVMTIENRAMLLSPLTSEDDLMIEIYDISLNKIDTIYNSDIKVNFIERMLDITVTSSQSIDVDGNLVVNFNQDITHALISLNSFYQDYQVVNSTTIKYDHDVSTFNNSNLSLNEIKAHIWPLLSKQIKEAPVSQDGEFYVFDYNVSENSLIVVNGKMYRYEIHESDSSKIKIINLDVFPSLADIRVIEFKHVNDALIKKYELVGVNDVPTNSSRFGYNLRHFIVNYNGLNVKYSLTDQLPMLKNVVSYQVPADLPVFDNLEVMSVTFGYNERSNYVNVGVLS